MYWTQISLFPDSSHNLIKEMKFYGIESVEGSIKLAVNCEIFGRWWLILVWYFVSPDCVSFPSDGKLFIVLLLLVAYY